MKNKKTYEGAAYRYRHMSLSPVPAYKTAPAGQTKRQTPIE